MNDRLVELGFAAGWRTVRALPEPAARRLFRYFADRAYRRNGPAVRRLRGNLRRVVGPDMPDAEFDTLIRDAVRSYARYWVEAFRLPSMSREQIVDRFEMEGAEAFDKHADAGEGMVISLPHSGNWDLAGAWLALTGHRMTTVAERLKPEGLYRRFLDFRRSLGMTIVPLTGGDRPANVVLAEKLAEANAVPLLADRDLTEQGVEVNFFGATARMPAGPALLAIRTKSPLYATVLYFDGAKTRGRLVGPLPIPADGRLSDRIAAATQTVADVFAEGIAAHPADWHMLQRLWPEDPPIGGRAERGTR